MNNKFCERIERGIANVVLGIIFCFSGGVTENVALVVASQLLIAFGIIRIIFAVNDARRNGHDE